MMRQCTYSFRYVWENIDIGYIQGMCDLVAPLLVILDDGGFFHVAQNTHNFMYANS